MMIEPPNSLFSSSNPIPEPAKAALKSSSWLVSWLMISQLLALLTLGPWCMMSVLAIMLFDSGPSFIAYAVTALIWCYPLFPLACSIGAWVSYFRGWRRLAAVLTSLPLIPLLLFMLTNIRWK
jgi:hypothetical protein